MIVFDIVLQNKNAVSLMVADLAKNNITIYICIILLKYDIASEKQATGL